MKKSLIVFSFLFCFLILFSACSPSNSTKKATANIDTDNSLPNVSTGSEQLDVFDVPRHKNMYFATGNDYYDLYVGYSWVPGPKIQLISREYIDPDSIHVSANIRADYTVYVTEQATGVSLTKYEIVQEEGFRDAVYISGNLYDFPLYLYQTYSGIDWADVGRNYTEYIELYQVEGADSEISNNAYKKYRYAATEHIDNYAKLAVDDIPTYYEYEIQICIIDAKIEELLTTVQVMIEENVYDINIGQVYIRPYYADNSGYEYFSMKMSSPYWISCYPYGKGIEQCQSEVYYAEKALSLTGLRFLENATSSVTVLDVFVIISNDVDSAYSGVGIEIDWDGVKPIYIEQGQYVTLHITVQDDRMKEINYHSKIYPVFEFECDNSAYEIISEIPLYRYYTDKWLLYAIGLDSLDMESYFNDYHYLTINEIWRNDVDLTPWGQEQ